MPNKKVEPVVKDPDFKDIAVRAVKTFAQAFLSVVVLGLFDIVDFASFQTLLVAGGAAGISAVQNFIKETY